MVMKKAEVMARTLEGVRIPVIDEALIAGAVYRRLRVHNDVSDGEGWRRFALYPDVVGFQGDFPAPPNVKKHVEY